MVVIRQEPKEALALEAGEAAAFALAKRYFNDFLDFVQVVEPPPGRGVIAFERWNHLVEVCENLNDEKLLVWLKSRQTGASWLLAAYSLWTAMYKEGALVLLLSQGEEESKVLLSKSRFIYERLPDGLKTALGTDSRQELTFPMMESGIRALPSTDKAGRSATASLVILDEADFHEHLAANYAAVKPTIDDGGGQLIMVSTSNAANARSMFKQIYQEAPDNGFKKIFYGWNVRPGRDNDWFTARQKEYADVSLFEKEYPASEAEALSPPRTIAAFDHDILNLMAQDCRAPIKKVQVGPVEASIWQEYHPGKRYVAATDTSHGTGGDWAITVVLDVSTGYVVADIQTNLIPPDQLSLASMELLKLYHNPVWGIEDNDWGVLTISTAREARYPHLYYRDDDKCGWHTDERSRYILWGELIEAVSDRLVVVPNQDGIDQFYAVIRNPKKNGRIEGQAGAHDDYPLAVGIAWQLRRFAQASGRNVYGPQESGWKRILGRNRNRSRW